MTPDLNETLRLQLAHRSVRRYTQNPIACETLELLVQCGQAAATSSFVQAYSIIRVTDPEHRKAIAHAAGGQPWIIKAAEFLIFCADLKRIDQACREAGEAPLEGVTEHSLVAIVDVSLMAQNLMLAAESLGLGGAYIGGIRNHPRVVVDCLQLPEQVCPVFGMCLGHPDQDTQIKPRLPVSMVLHDGSYQDTTPARLATYNERMAQYYETRSDQRKDTNWSRETAKAMQDKKRLHMSAFLRQRGFFKR